MQCRNLGFQSINNSFKTINAKLDAIAKRKFFKYGVPFLALLLGGSFGLQQFSQLRYTYSKKQLITPAEAEKMGVKMKKPEEVTLESEFEKIKDLDIENWDNIRGPRPWEEPTTEQKPDEKK
jgi:cytochrome c oxidase assembly protein subunit 16